MRIKVGQDPVKSGTLDSEVRLAIEKAVYKNQASSISVTYEMSDEIRQLLKRDVKIDVYVMPVEIDE